jgi:hypothetical protein
MNNSAIIVALIGLAGGLAGIVLNHLLVRRGAARNPTNNRRAAVSGRWTGNIHQIKGLESVPVDFPVDFHLKSKSNLTGDARFTWMDQRIELEITGKFVDDSTISLEFNDKDPSVLRCGVIVFRVSPDTRRLNGTFAGFVPEMEVLMHGTIDLEKK